MSKYRTKNFKGIGYVAYRSDGTIYDRTDYGHIHLSIVKFDKEDTWRNGDEYVNLYWQTDKPSYGDYEADKLHWYGTSLKVHPFGSLADYDVLEKAWEVVRNITKYFGYSVTYNEVVRQLPDSAAVEQAWYELDRGKNHYGYEPYWNALTPEILVHIGFPSLNIPRVVKDGRDEHGYVLEEDRLPDNIRVWRAKYNGVYLGETKAVDAREAKNNLFVAINDEIGRLESGQPKIAFPKDKEKYIAAATGWFENGFPVMDANVSFPTPTDLVTLTSLTQRWHGKTQY